MIPVAELELPSQLDIVARIRARDDGDFFKWEVSEYVNFLDYAHAKAWLKEEVSEAEWEKARVPHTKENVLDTMKRYQTFAWEKANDCRGLSAQRSIMHYIAWAWLLGDADFAEEIDRLYYQEYDFYGKPILIRIAERYGFDWKQFDDGERKNSEKEE